MRLSMLISRLKKKSEQDSSRLESLLRKRADIIGKAAGKIPRLIRLIEQHKKESESAGKKYQHILFYCNRGTHREVLKTVADRGIRVHEFVHTEIFSMLADPETRKDITKIEIDDN